MIFGEKNIKRNVLHKTEFGIPRTLISMSCDPRQYLPAYLHIDRLPFYNSVKYQVALNQRNSLYISINLISFGWHCCISFITLWFILKPITKKRIKSALKLQLNFLLINEDTVLIYIYITVSHDIWRWTNLYYYWILRQARQELARPHTI